MTTNQSGVILILCSGLALLWSTQSQLIRTANSCDDIICPGSNVQYNCSVPISGSVVVWRMMPECERNGEQPDIIFLFSDSPLSIVCNDGRKIMVQGMTTSNGNRFVSTLNVTNITQSSQTTECLFDDGSEEETVGNDTVFTTAPVPNVTNIDATTDLVLITLDQQSLKENCTLIDYAVSSSTECGTCGRVVDNSISCTNAQVGAGCTVTIETTLCSMLENILPINITTMVPITQAGSPSSEAVAAIVVPIIMTVIVAISIIIIVALCCGKNIKGKKSKNAKSMGQQLIVKIPENPQTTSSKCAGNREQNENVSLKNYQPAQDLCGTNPEAAPVSTLQETDVDESGGNDTMVSSSAKNESIMCAKVEAPSNTTSENAESVSIVADADVPDYNEGVTGDTMIESTNIAGATKLTMEERSSDVAFTDKEVSAEGKRRTDENQTKAINSSEGAGSTVQDSSDQTLVVYTKPMVGKRDSQEITGALSYPTPRHKVSQESQDDFLPHGNSMTRSAKPFTALPPEEYYPAQQVTDERQRSHATQLDHSANPQIMSYLEKLTQGQEDLKRENKQMWELINSRNSEIDALKHEIRTLQGQVKEVQDNEKAKIEQYENKIKTLKEEDKAKIKQYENKIKMLKEKNRSWMEKYKKKLQQEKDDKEKEFQKKLAELPLEDEAGRKQLNEELVKFKTKIDKEIKKIDKELEQMEQEDGQL